MKYKFTKIILLTAVVAGLTTACTPAGENIPTGKRYEFNNILDITCLLCTSNCITETNISMKV